MAILGSEDLSLEIRYAAFSVGWVQYEIFFRWKGEDILNENILKRRGGNWADRTRGAVLANEDEACCILPTIDSVLRRNEPDYCEPIEPDILLALYPEVLFPFLPGKWKLVRENEDFKRQRRDRALRKRTRGLLPDDPIEVMLLVDTYNFKDCSAYSGNGICLKMTVRREQLEEFYSHLKAEYAEFRGKYKHV